MPQDLSEGMTRLETIFPMTVGIVAELCIRQPSGNLMVLDSTSSWWVLTLAGSSLNGVETTTRERFISTVQKDIRICRA